ARRIFHDGHRAGPPASPVADVASSGRSFKGRDPLDGAAIFPASDYGSSTMSSTVSGPEGARALSAKSQVRPLPDSRQVTIFVDYSDPLGGVTTWGLRLARHLGERSLLCGVETEDVRHAYAERFVPEASLTQIVAEYPPLVPSE